MTPSITQSLIQPDHEKDAQVKIEVLKKIYGDDKVQEAIDYLTYRNVQELPKNEDPNHPILYVFRHGETEDNAHMIFSGWRDVGLTEKGVEQAGVLAEKIKDKKIQMLVTSDQERAIDTMKVAISKNEYAKTLEIHQDPRLRERSYGDWQGESKLVAQLTDPEGLHKVRRGYYDKPPNAESLEETVKRVGNFLDEVIPLMKRENINVAISCHGNSIRGIRQYFEKLSNEEAAEIETPLGKDYAAYSIT